MGAAIRPHPRRRRVRLDVSSGRDLLDAEAGEDAPSNDFLSGYFTGLRVIRADTAPASFLPPLMPDNPEVADSEDASVVTAWLVSLYANAGRDLSNKEFPSPDDIVEWSQGFAKAVDLRADIWKEALDEPAMQELVAPILAAGTDAEAFFADNGGARNQLLNALPEILAAVWTVWRNPALIKGGGAAE